MEYQGEFVHLQHRSSLSSLPPPRHLWPLLLWRCPPPRLSSYRAIQTTILGPNLFPILSRSLHLRAVPNRTGRGRLPLHRSVMPPTVVYPVLFPCRISYNSDQLIYCLVGMQEERCLDGYRVGFGGVKMVDRDTGAGEWDVLYRLRGSV
jgi:hypothetical protein